MLLLISNTYSLSYFLNHHLIEDPFQLVLEALYLCKNEKLQQNDKFIHTEIAIMIILTLSSILKVLIIILAIHNQIICFIYKIRKLSLDVHIFGFEAYIYIYIYTLIWHDTAQYKNNEFTI